MHSVYEEDWETMPSTKKKWKGANSTLFSYVKLWQCSDYATFPQSKLMALHFSAYWSIFENCLRQNPIANEA